MSTTTAQGLKLRSPDEAEGRTHGQSFSHRFGYRASRATLDVPRALLGRVVPLGLECEPMKWVLLSVAVFLGSVAVFVAMPRSALLWVANSLPVFGDGVAHVGGSTSRPQGSAPDEVNPVETRRRETIQADVAGRARVIDGDTIEVGSARIRLFGVDAPESAKAVSRGAAAGRAVSRRPARLPGASTVDRSRARSAIGIGTGESLPSAATADRTSMPGWCVRVGR